MHDRLDALLSRCKQHGSALSLIHLDIDGQRRRAVTDGWLAAFDQHRLVHRTVTDLLRRDDLCTPLLARAIVWILPGCDLEQALGHAGRVRLRLGEFRFEATVSIGAVQTGPAEFATGDVLRGAARALAMESKSLGGGHTLCTSLTTADRIAAELARGHAAVTDSSLMAAFDAAVADAGEGAR